MRMNKQIHKYIGTNTLLTIITTTLIIIELRGNMCRKEKCAEHKNVPVEEMCRAPPRARNLQSHSAQDHPLSLSALLNMNVHLTMPCHVPIPYHHTITCHASPYLTMPHHTMSMQYILWAADPRCHPNPCHQTRASYRSLTLVPPAKFLYLVMQPLFSLTSQNRHFQISFRRADKISENDNDPMDIWEIMQQRRYGSIRGE